MLFGLFSFSFFENEGLFPISVTFAETSKGGGCFEGKNYRSMYEGLCNPIVLFAYIVVSFVNMVECSGHRETTSMFNFFSFFINGVDVDFGIFTGDSKSKSIKKYTIFFSRPFEILEKYAFRGILYQLLVFLKILFAEKNILKENFWVRIEHSGKIVHRHPSSYIISLKVGA